MASNPTLKSFTIDFSIQLKIGLLLKYYETVLDKYTCYTLSASMNHK